VSVLSLGLDLILKCLAIEYPHHEVHSQSQDGVGSYHPLFVPQPLTITPTYHRACIPSFLQSQLPVC
jgi:hypothetical protein